MLIGQPMMWAAHTPSTTPGRGSAHGAGLPRQADANVMPKGLVGGGGEGSKQPAPHSFYGQMGSERTLSPQGALAGLPENREWPLPLPLGSPPCQLQSQCRGIEMGRWVKFFPPGNHQGTPSFLNKGSSHLPSLGPGYDYTS